MSSARFARRLLGSSAIASLAFVPGALQAQVTSSAIDARFQPWVGCWRPIDTGIGLEELDSEKQPTRACVVPSTSVTGTVDLVLFYRDSVMSRTAVPIPGKPIARKIDDCEGTQSAAWVPGNARLVLKAELICDRGVKRLETGLLTMNDAGQWVQLQHLQVGKNEATTVARFRFEGDSSAPAGIAVGTVRSTRSLRMAAGGAVEVNDVIELAKLAPPSLTEAWLSDLGQRIDLNAKALVQLADGGVPSRVIDVMVALAHPDKYQIGPAMTGPNGSSQGRAIASLQQGSRGGGSNRLRTRCQYMDDFCYGPGGMGAWGFGYRYGLYDPWGFGYFNPYRLGGGLWGFNPYSAWGPWGFGGGFWNPGLGTVGGPVVIVPGGGGSGSGASGGAVRGRAVQGGGYTREGYSAPRSPSSYSPPMSPGGGMGGSSGGASGGSSGGGDGGGRTAKPRGGSL